MSKIIAIAVALIFTVACSDESYKSYHSYEIEVKFAQDQDRDDPLIPVDLQGNILKSKSQPSSSHTWEWTCQGSLDPGQLCLLFAYSNSR